MLNLVLSISMHLAVVGLLVFMCACSHSRIACFRMCDLIEYSVPLDLS